MTAHTGIAMVGASAVFLLIVECIHKSCKWRHMAAAGLAFGCMVVLAFMPCWPTQQTHHPPEPTVEQRPDIDAVEKLLLANYRRVKTEREISDAWPK